MSNAGRPRSRSLMLANEVLVGAGLVLALIGYGVLRHPASVSQNGLLSLFECVVVLLGFGIAALWARRQRPGAGAAQTALTYGAKLGLVLGIAEVLNMSLENFGQLSGSLGAVVGVSMWGLMFLLYGAASSATFRKVGSLPPAVLASVWSAVVGTVVTCLFGFASSLGFMAHMQQILNPEYTRSQMTDPQAFVVQYTMMNAATHLILSPFLAAGCGFTAGVVSAYLRPVRRTVALGLLLLETLQLLLGLAALRFAVTTLARPQRPPFVMGGLLALGVALSCAPPLLARLRGGVEAEVRASEMPTARR
jgi:hypothetical protein